MPASKNICLLGFSKEVESKIKETIAANAGGKIVNWVPANDKSLDGAVINAGFLEAPQIEKYIGMVGKPIVCSHGSHDAALLASKKQLHSIPWVGAAANVKEWLAVLFGESQAKPAPMPASPTARPASTQSAASRPISSQTSLHDFKASSNAKKDDNGAILKRIQKGENTIFAAFAGNSATWIKPAEGIVFINYPRENVPSYEDCLWEEVSADSIPPAARQLKLDLWIFETLWQSHIDGSKYIDVNANFRLIRWPQPLSRQGRTEALRLAACAQGYPTNVKTLNEKTNYPTDRIHRFLFATMAAGQTEQILGAITEPKPVKPQMDEEKKAEKRSLLARFRAKLGL